MSQRQRLFISYSHEDAKWLKCVRVQLMSLERLNLIDIFADTSIVTGEDWKARIDQEMRRAKLAMLLMSPTFLNSPFIQDKELPHILDRHTKEGMNIYPILVIDCAWDEFEWLARLQIRPHSRKPLSGLRKNAREKELVKIVKEIAELVRAPMRAEGRTESDPIDDDANGGRIYARQGARPSVKAEGTMETFFINSFSEYCEHCAKMMSRATGEVRTVQTPARVAGDSRSFREYLSVTADKIVRPSGHPTFGVTLYRRLVVVDAASFESESKKLEVFFEALRDAIDRAKKENVTELDLSCLGICIVHRETMARIFHSNLDVHITSPNECAVAFHSPQTGREGHENFWRTCLYASLGVESNADRLIQSYDHVWNEGRRLGGEVPVESVETPEEHLRVFESTALTVLRTVACGHIEVRNSGNANLRRIIEKSDAYSNLFFKNAKNIPVKPQALVPLAREWYAITRAFALQTPQYVALIARECRKVNGLATSRQFERALQIASSISAGEFGIGMSLSSKIHFRLFSSELSPIVGIPITDLHKMRAGTWPETKVVIALFERSFDDLHRGAGVLCTIEVTAYHIVAAMSSLFRGHSISYVDLHLEIEQGHAELADELCTCIFAARENDDDSGILQGAKDICEALGRFWGRMADEVFSKVNASS